MRTSKDWLKIFHQVTGDSRYAEGILYGKPRKGHQEGEVYRHIAELGLNLQRLHDYVTPIENVKLMILIHVHDTFKKWAKRNAPIDQENSHATLARTFLAEFLDKRSLEDQDLLAMVQWHDENYAIWKKFHQHGNLDVCRISERVMRILDIELFLIFTIIDGFTESKMGLASSDRPGKIRWFIEIIDRWQRVNRAKDALLVFGL